MQRSAIGYGAASSEIHVRHVHRHCAILYLVRQRHILGYPTPKLYNDLHTVNNNSAFNQACMLEKLNKISARHGWQVDASGAGVVNSDNALIRRERHYLRTNGKKVAY